MRDDQDYHGDQKSIEYFDLPDKATDNASVDLLYLITLRGPVFFQLIYMKLRYFFSRITDGMIE